MAPLKIIGMDVVSDGDRASLIIIVLGQVGFLILKAAEPPFNHDIIRPAAFPVHAPGKCHFFHKVDVLLTGKLRSLDPNLEFEA